MDVFQNRHIVTFLKMKHSIGLHSTTLLSASISQVEERPSPSTLPIFPSPVIKHLGSVTSGQAVKGNINVDWKSWVSESLMSTTMSA